MKFAKPVERQRAVCCCCSFADDVTKTYILALLEQLRDGGIFALKQHTHVLSLLFHIYWSLISTSSKVSCHMIASVKTECVAVLTNLRWHCSHGHTTMTSQRVGVHSFESRPNEAVIWGSLFGETITRTNTQAWPHVWIVWLCVHCPGGGTPYVMGDTYVPRFWPPFFTLAGSSTIFLGYFFSSTNTKTIFWVIKTTNSYRIRSFRPQISFFPRSFWVQFSAASGTPPSFFGPSTPPGVHWHCIGLVSNHWSPLLR